MPVPFPRMVGNITGNVSSGVRSIPHENREDGEVEGLRVPI